MRCFSFGGIFGHISRQWVFNALGFSTLTSAFTEVLAAKNGLGWLVTVLKCKIVKGKGYALHTFHLTPQNKKIQMPSKTLQSQGRWCAEVMLFRVPLLPICSLLFHVLEYNIFGPEIAFFRFCFWTVFFCSILSNKEEKWRGICTS